MGAAAGPGDGDAQVGRRERRLWFVDAAIRGPAETLLLVLMGRADERDIDVVGDPLVADGWLSLPGW
jgi:hypothetical protein